jgi:hypothetical protein
MILESFSAIFVLSNVFDSMYWGSLLSESEVLKRLQMSKSSLEHLEKVVDSTRFE